MRGGGDNSASFELKGRVYPPDWAAGWQGRLPMDVTCDREILWAIGLSAICE